MLAKRTYMKAKSQRERKVKSLFETGKSLFNMNEKEKMKDRRPLTVSVSSVVIVVTRAREQ